MHLFSIVVYIFGSIGFFSYGKKKINKNAFAVCIMVVLLNMLYITNHNAVVVLALSLYTSICLSLSLSLCSFAWPLFMLNLTVKYTLDHIHTYTIDNIWKQKKLKILKKKKNDYAYQFTDDVFCFVFNFSSVWFDIHVLFCVSCSLYCQSLNALIRCVSISRCCGDSLVSKPKSKCAKPYIKQLVTYTVYIHFKMPLFNSISIYILFIHHICVCL